MTIKVKQETAVEEVREACAKICGEFARRQDKECRESGGSVTLTSLHAGGSAAGETLAERIRSLQFEVEDGWVSVEDRLPEMKMNLIGQASSDDVLVIDNDGEQTIEFLTADGKWSGSTDADMYFVTHWRPLPAPPKAEEGK